MTHPRVRVIGTAVGVAALMLFPLPGVANDDRDRDDGFHARLKGF